MSLSEQEKRKLWLQKRRQGLGSTDAAAIMGISSYSSPLQVYCEKVGAWSDDSMTEQQEVGLLMEPVIKALAERKLGVPLTRGEHVVHPVHSWLCCTPDNLTPDGEPVDAKNMRSSQGWGQPGTDEAPELYVVQIIHQCMVLEQMRGYLAPLFNGHKLELYPIARTKEVSEMLFELLHDFWHYNVLQQIVPDIDYTHPNTKELLNALNPPREEVEVTIGHDDERRAYELIAVKETIKAMEKRKEELEAHLTAAMGEASIGLCPSGLEVKRKRVQYTRKPIPEKEVDYVTLSIKEPKE